MATIDVKRNYTMIDAELSMFASDLCVRLTRDLSDVSVFGVQASSISALKAIGDAFEIFPSDDAYHADVMLATQNKNEIANQVRESIRNMALHVQLKWGASSPQHRSLGDLAVSKFSDDVLLASAKKILGRMEGYLLDLASTGLTQANLDDFDDLIDSYELALNNLSSAIELRDIKTKERVLLGNELYGLVVNYCEIGKRVYEKTDPAKYNDYIIYEKSPGGLSAPKNFRFFRGSRVFAWDLVPNATSYAMEMSYNQTDWEQVFYEEWNETEFDVPEGWSYYRVRAHNGGGFGEYCDVLAIEYYRMLPTPQNFRLELVESTPKKARCVCDVVPTAESYMTYVSVVNIGASPGDWTGANSDVIPEVYNPLVAGKRNYFQMQAQNEGQSSLKTEALYLDVPIS